MNAIMQWFDDPRLVRLGMSLVHFLWQGALLGVAAAIVMTWMRGASSRRRYAVLLTALFGMAIAPVVTFLMLPTPRTHAERAFDAPPAMLPVHEMVSKALATTAIPTAPRAAPSSQIDNGAETPAAAAPAIGFSARLSLAWTWIVGRLSWFVAAWAAGVCLFSVRLMIGLGGASRVRRIGVTPVPADCQAWSAELAATFGIRRTINLGQSALVKVPVLVGWLRPIVLLPASVITGLPEPELRAILAHELAHIRRHDYLINTLQTMVETLLFYHPAVWWLSNAIRQEREQCCDDLAAVVCGDRVVVAKALVRLAEVRALAGSAALAATGGRLGRRIRRLLTRPSDSKRPAPWQSLAGASVAILLTAGILVSVNTLAGGFAESPASAQEPTSKTNDIKDASQAKPDSKESKDSDGQPAKSLPVLSKLPFASRLFIIPANEQPAGGGNEKSQSAATDRSPDAAEKPRADRTETRRFPVEQLAAPISLDYRDVPLDKALEGLRDKTNLSIMVDESALKRLDVSQQRRISVMFNDIAVKDALRLILQAADPRLTYQVKEDYLFVTVGEKPAEGDPAQTETPKSKVDEMKRGLGLLEKEIDKSQRELLRTQQQLRSEQGKSEADLKQEAEALLPLRQQFAEKERELQQKRELIDKYRMEILELQMSRQAELKRAGEADIRRVRQTQLRDQELTEANRLEGTWKVVGWQIDGQEGPTPTSQSWTFRGHQVAVDYPPSPPPSSTWPPAGYRSTEEKPAQEEGRWKTFFLNPSKSEKEITIVGRSMLVQAIYRLDGDTLTICYFGRSEADRPTSFKPKEDDVLPHTVWTLHRVESDSKQSH